MKEKLLIFIGTLILFILGSLLLYPKPAEIITLTVIGYGIFIGLVLAYERWDRTHKTGNNGKRKLFVAFLSIYIITLQLIHSTSWFGHRLIFNIFESQDGRAFFVITIGTLILILIYFLVFYLKNGRWPDNKDIGIKEK